LHAEEQNLDTNLISTEITQLSKDPQWHFLLAYGLTDKDKKSSITNSSFFLSNTGNIDPREELIATLIAFAQNTNQPDLHAQCRFPARYIWLNHHLDFQKLGISPLVCPKFKEFSQNNHAESISIIFATGYLGNPASYYGHLLLKINNSTDTTMTDLENTAINFGANVPANENMLKYIVKGIFGGYDSSFTQQQYFYHTHNYGESELRDLWEYELDIDTDNLSFLIAHLWEVMSADYTYYFFNRNCAYRLGELLQAVSENNLVDTWRPWEAPQAIMQRLSNSSLNGKPLVKRIRYLPSRQSRLYQRYKKLSSSEREAVHKIVHSPNLLNSKILNSLDISQQYQVVDTLLDYYQFIRKEKEGQKDKNNEKYRDVLSKRYELPPNIGMQNFASSNEPHLGRKPSYLNLGVASSISQGESLNLWLRPAYYDSLDGGYGHIKNAALSMGELNLTINANESYIRSINLVKIESVRRNYTNLPGDRHSSWYLTVGAEQQWLTCTDCLATNVKSGYGYASSILNDSVLIAGYLGGGFLGRSTHNDGIYAAGIGTINMNLSDDFSLRGDIEHRQFYDTTDSIIYRAQARWHFSSQMDFRATFAQDIEQEFALSVGLYW
jgi:hypothetical protein